MFSKPYHEYLTEKRIELDLLQKDMADRFGISTRRWCHLENGTQRPSDTELQQFLAAFGELPGSLSPSAIIRKLTSAGRRLLPKSSIYLSPQDRSPQARYYSALRDYREFVRRMTAIVRRRQDFRECDYLCSLIAFGSAAEVLLVLRLLEAGAVPALQAPCLLGRLPHPVIDPKSRQEVSHRAFASLVLGDRHFFFQVPMATPRYYCVDVLEWNGSWIVIEIDGFGHNHANDDVRSAALGVPVRRLRPDDIMATDFQI